MVDHKPKCTVRYWIAEFKVTSIDFFWTAELFVTRLGMVINHKPEFNAKNIGLLSSRSNSDSRVMARALGVMLRIKMTISVVSSALLMTDPFATEFVWWHIIINWSVSVKRLLCCGQGQGHSEVKNIIECLSRWYLQNIL